MTLLDLLWDDTVAGPLPESGLGKLRKYHTFNSAGKESSDNNRSQTSKSAPAAAPVDDAVKVTRNIRPPKLDLMDSPPVSPSTGGDVQVQVEERHTIGNTAGEELVPFRMRKQLGLDPIALLLLTCDL